MVVGADDALGIVALSLTGLRGCFKGLTVLSKARHYTRDISNVRLQIELSLQSLFTWAEDAGLTQEPPTLLVSARHATLVVNILGQLDCLLQDLSHLKETYGLDLSLEPGNVDALDDEDSTLSKLGLKQREYTRRADIAIFRQRKEPWKRLRWVTLDDRKVARLLKKINGFNRELEKFLEQSKQAERDRYLELAYRDAVLNANGQQELHVLGQESELKAAPANVAIAAAARLKQTRLRLGLDENVPLLASVANDKGRQIQIAPPNSSHSQRSCRLDSPLVPLDSMRLSIRSLTLPRLARAPYLSRVMAFYDASAVLLEWKSGPTLRDARIIDKRVEQVAAFLHELKPSFHSLPCRGYVKDHEANRYGYVFDLSENLSTARLQHGQHPPNASQRMLPSLPEMSSLYDQLENSNRIPSLNSRLKLSILILETILNLHTSGWLHKEFRSANVILIRPAETVECPSDLSTYTVFVAGYVYARADEPNELTEPLASSSEADLYRHPSSLGESREPYGKTFDLFSVGCTLLEVGLWTSLRQILANHATASVSTSAYHTQGPQKPLSEESPISHDTLAPRQTEANSASKNLFRASHSDNGSKNATLDYMKLRHELLYSPLESDQKQLSATRAIEPSETPQARCSILQSLEAAMGTTYTRIVQELLLAAGHIGGSGGNAFGDEHDTVLDLEVKAKDVVQAIANAV